ncbi:hypothetical protein MMC15_004176 [Xylographa vitiligo]|nr:hypothetical protein [Xylographa vitiligo]
MHTLLCSAVRNTDIEKEDNPPEDPPAIDISSITKQDIFYPAWPPHYVLNDVNLERGTCLHADEFSSEAPGSRTFHGTLSAAEEKPCIPDCSTRKAPDAALDTNSSSHASSTCTSPDHKKRTSTSSPAPLCSDSSMGFPHVSPHKRKRGADIFSSAVANRVFSVSISERDLQAEQAEPPRRKKAKLHNRKQIVTGSGDVEYIVVVCQVHAGDDISLPVSHCRECRRVDGIIHDEINAYGAWLPFKNKMYKNKIGYKNAMQRWLRTRLALANYKIELEGAKPPIQVSSSSLQSSDAVSSNIATRKCVRFDPACLTDEGAYRERNRFLRESRHYKPGKYSAPNGTVWENSSKIIQEEQP